MLIPKDELGPSGVEAGALQVGGARVPGRGHVELGQIHADLARHGAFEDEGFTGSGGHF